MKAFEYSKMLYKLARYEIMEKFHHEPLQFEQTVQDMSAQIQEKGFVLFEGYYPEDKCEAIITEIDRLHAEYKDKVWTDELKADTRLFGAESKSALISEFFNDVFINQIRNCYYRTSNVVGCTLAARIKAIENNLGSGGGWHRDSIYGTQLKAILYLTDVSPKHGPFEYLTATHNQSAKLEAIKKCGVKANQNRLSEEIVNKLLKLGNYDLNTFTAKRGTLLIVDTTGIHRGKPIEQENRYALTNYWYLGKKIPAVVKDLMVS